MKADLFLKIHKMNNLASEIDSIYHEVSRILGTSDSDMRILYTIHEDGDGCLLSSVYKKSGVNKQTINSSLRKLEREEILFLEKGEGKNKRIFLTEKGKEYMKQTAARLFDAECDAFASWREEEVDMYINLLEKDVDSFRKAVKRLGEENENNNNK